jgi:leucine dehydrogenase
MVNQLAGEFQTDEDVKTTLEDMGVIYTETNRPVTLLEHCDGEGDISPFTALCSVGESRVWGNARDEGLLRGSPRTRGRWVAHVGDAARARRGIRGLWPDKEKVARAVKSYGVQVIPPAEIYEQNVDILGPGALGGVINLEIISRLKVKIVAGSANNILANEDRDMTALDNCRIDAVNYVANSGGAIIDADCFCKGGLQHERGITNVFGIFQRTEEVFAIAVRDGISAYLAANRMAGARIGVLNHVRLLG